MKHEQSIKEIFDLSFPAPSPGQTESACERVLHRLTSAVDDSAGELAAHANSVRPEKSWWRLAPVRVAAFLAVLVLLSIPFVRTFILPDNVYAVVETVDGGLYRLADGQSYAVNTGERIDRGNILHTNGGTGAVLDLADGSRIEMRSNSELALESADDGMRVRLNAGSVIVTAAKQHNGHLYVLTKDVTVSVVGTVFLVNAEEAGSRVAVIQGEVHVQQGTASKKLLPGEQMATNPLMELHPVSEEISWSRSASAHKALLQQSAVPGATPENAIAPPRLEFEVASLKPVPRGGYSLSSDHFQCRGIDGTLSSVPFDLFFGESIDSGIIPQGRCIGNTVTPMTLVAFAYAIPKRRISGGPDWPEIYRSNDIYQIEAKAETPSIATEEQFRQMLQTLLADRFKLKVHRETKEAQGYILLVGKNRPKLKDTSDEEEILPLSFSASGFTIKGKFRVKTFADSLSMLVDGSPVIDKTNLPGVYNISLTLNLAGGGGGPRGGGSAQENFDPPLAKALEDQLGLRLESGKVPVEYLVVDHIDKPSPN